jgi:hypothetical protein
MFGPVDVSAKEAVAAVAYDEMGVPAQEFDRLITGEEEQT